MTARVRRFFPALLTIICAGCSTTTFTEADRGQTREVYVGTDFSISLPSSGPAGWGEPKISGSIVRFLSKRRDESSNRDLFDFKAEGRGETDVRIPVARSGKAEEYVIRVKVKSSSDAYSMPVRQ